VHPMMTHMAGDSPSPSRSRLRRRTRSPRIDWRYAFWRLFWLLAASVHLPALAGFGHRLFGDSPSEASAVRAVVLLVGLAFCTLKALDLPVLRVKPTWQSRCACILILLLLHIGMVPGLGDRLVVTVEAGTTGVGMAVSLLTHARRMPAVASLCHRACAGSIERERDPFPTEWETSFHPFDTFLAPAYAGPRAPPRQSLT
jgi:hypothetical protein